MPDAPSRRPPPHVAVAPRAVAHRAGPRVSEVPAAHLRPQDHPRGAEDDQRDGGSSSESEAFESVKPQSRERGRASHQCRKAALRTRKLLEGQRSLASASVARKKGMGERGSKGRSLGLVSTSTQGIYFAPEKFLQRQSYKDPSFEVTFPPRNRRTVTRPVLSSSHPREDPLP